MSRPPRWPIAVAKAASLEARSRTSIATAAAPPPISAASACAAAMSRSAIATRTPAPASARTIAAPMPRAPPVTSARRPERSKGPAMNSAPGGRPRFSQRRRILTSPAAGLRRFCLPTIRFAHQSRSSWTPRACPPTPLSHRNPTPPRAACRRAPATPAFSNWSTATASSRSRKSPGISRSPT